MPRFQVVTAVAKWAVEMMMVVIATVVAAVREVVVAAMVGVATEGVRRIPRNIRHSRNPKRQKHCRSAF